jgi:phospholipid/cholesterol/gamma-HCH transport system substrate-binding protein
VSPAAVRAAAIKLGLFAVVAGAVLATILATIDPFGSGGGTVHRADFTSASRLSPGDDVRVAGVRVGSVRSVGLTDDATARVTFDVPEDLVVTRATRVEIRYLDLTGNRYLALVNPNGEAERQPPGAVIGLDRTRPALDLDQLLDGFEPLLVALSPEEVNDFTLDLVRTLQGDGSTVRSLVRRTASLTNGLAERDQLIADVITNLDASVGAVAGRHDQLAQLVGDLRVFASGLARDRDTVGDAIGHVDTMTMLMADLLEETRPATRKDIAHLRSVAEALSSKKGRAEVDHALDHLPDKLARLAATAGYGSFFNYYLCGIRLDVGNIPGLSDAVRRMVQEIHLVDTSRRCRP